MELRIRAQNGTLAHNGEKTASIPTSGNWIIEPKFDGWRILAEVHEDGVHFYTRSGLTYDGRLPLVEKELLQHFPAGTWLDGEAVAISYVDGKVRNEWGIAQSVLTKVGPHAAADKITYMLFDLIAHRGIDARTLPFRKRRELLERAYTDKGMVAVQLSTQLPATQESHAALVKVGFEGSVAKNLDAPYASGRRGHGLLKWKAVESADVVVIGFEAGRDVGTVVFGQLRDGELVERGRCKRKPSVIPTPDLMAWMGKVIEIEHNGVMPSGAYRHPRLTRVRDDKPAEACTW